MQQVIATLPASVPSPRFQLFQKVQYQSGDKKKPVTAIISGLAYIDFHTALIEDMSYSGWRYEISNVLGKFEAELLGLNDEVSRLVREDQIIAITTENCNA